jgi:D-alanyl-D-alanine carboxypeptidase (penicillin-binding protein 5/6)
LVAAGATIAEARVQGGDVRAVPLVASRPVDAVMPAGAAEAIELRVVYRGPLLAPLTKGAKIANLEIRIDGRTVGEVPLQAGQSVRTASLIDRLFNGIYGLFA